MEDTSQVFEPGLADGVLRFRCGGLLKSDSDWQMVNAVTLGDEDTPASV